MQEPMSTKSYISGLRISKISTVLKDLAFLSGVTISMEVDKHLLRETVRYELIGPEENIKKFKEVLENYVETFNGDMEETMRKNHG